jgi:hypothetical protein
MERDELGLAERYISLGLARSSEGKAMPRWLRRDIWQRRV